MAFPANTFEKLSKRGHEAATSSGLDAPIEPSPASRTFRLATNAALLLRVFAFAAAVPYLLRLKLPRVARVLEPRRDPSAVDKDRIGRIASYVEIAIRHGGPFVRPGCLTRGLTRYYFFRRAGIDVDLCFGMGRLDQEFMGHCWLVKDGEPFLEMEDPRSLYAEMYRFSRAGSRASTPAEVSGFRRLSNS
jgi:hypothetical protein